MPRLIDRKTATRLLVLSALGAIAPITFLFGNCLSIDALYDFPHWIVFVWPTSLILLGVSGSSCPDSGFLMAMAFSLIGNVIVWVTVGFLLCWLLVDIPWKRLVLK